MTRGEIYALNSMSAAFPALPPDVERAAVSGMDAAVAIPFLVHHNTATVVSEILSRHSTCGRVSHSSDLSVGSVMDLVHGAAVDWLGSGMRGTFSEYAVERVLRDLAESGTHLLFRKEFVSVDARSAKVHGGETFDNVDYIMMHDIDRSYLGGMAASLRGKLSYDPCLDAVVVRKDRKVRVVRDVSRLAESGYAADVRRFEERRLRVIGPAVSKKVRDRIVNPSSGVRKRWTWRMRGFNPTWTRYMKSGKLVPVYGLPPFPVGPGRAVTTDIAGNKEYVPELPEDCSPCLCYPACRTHTVSGSRSFTYGIHRASVCKERPLYRKGGLP